MRVAPALVLAAYPWMVVAQSNASDSVPAPLRAQAGLAGRELRVMTYNVEGLPWPVAQGRGAAMRAIGERLADLRAKSQAPQVIALQEAFIGEARMIRVLGGYRYVAYGPDAAKPAANEKARRVQPVVSSGLILLSDFPISTIASIPFPANACSGFDCLANKGFLVVRVHPPGVEPVTIVTAHLNSNWPSGRPEPVNRIAWTRQLDALDRWIEARQPQGVRIFAGDFNVGHSPERLKIFLARLSRWRVHEVTAMGRSEFTPLCRRQRVDCTGAILIPPNVPLVHANDWQFYQAPAGADVTPLARAVVFGNTRSLSDHLGFSVSYRLG
jgi:endonuclease/exonuclease/phosphatase family metal-dependent hydrolase